VLHIATELACFKKEASLIAEHLRLDDQNLWKIRLNNQHLILLTRMRTGFQYQLTIHGKIVPTCHVNLEGSVRSRSREGAAGACDATSLKPD
jgi:hypothetical protein